MRNVTQMVGLDVSLYHKFMVLPLEIWSMDLGIEPFLLYFIQVGVNPRTVSSRKVLDLSKCTIEKRSNIPG